MLRFGRPIVTPEWVKDAVFYQVFPDRFARSGRVTDMPGPLEPWDAAADRPRVQGRRPATAIADRLDYLADLGITAIYLNPIFSSASNHRYHTYDYLVGGPAPGRGRRACASCWTGHTRVASG